MDICLMLTCPGLHFNLDHGDALQLREELSILQSKLDRIIYLMRIINPIGETIEERDLKVQQPKS